MSQKTESRKDIQMFARFVTIVLHLEMKNYDICDGLWRSAYRYANMDGQLTDYESIVLKYLKKLTNVAGTTDQPQVSEDFEKALVELSEKANEDRNLGITELIYWLRSKNQKKAFAGVIRKELDVGQKG